jgi:hypothetical protein
LPRLRTKVISSGFGAFRIGWAGLALVVPDDKTMTRPEVVRIKSGSSAECEALWHSRDAERMPVIKAGRYPAFPRLRRTASKLECTGDLLVTEPFFTELK